jgi:Protein of unknown function (DUF2000)
MRLDTKIVIVVPERLAPHAAINAAAVLRLNPGGHLPHLLGADCKDASRGVNAGLNTHPVPVAPRTRSNSPTCTTGAPPALMRRPTTMGGHSNQDCHLRSTGRGPRPPPPVAAVR